MDKYQIYRRCNTFFEFDSVKIIEEVKSLNTELEQIQFFEGVKMEFDIASHFCKCQIDRMQHYREFQEKFHQKEAGASPAPTHEIFIKEQFTADSDHSWESIFCSEGDYEFWVNNLKSFFNSEKYDALTKIEIKPNCRTRLCNILHDIYFFCSPLKQLKHDKKFLSLIKNLSPFSDLNTNAIYYRLIHY